MAVSNSYNYFDTYTGASAIAVALRRLGVYDPSETINATEQTNALEILNLVLKELEGKGVDVHLRRDAYLFLTSKTKQLYTTSADYVALSHNTTRLDGAHSASDTTLTVDSISGISASDIVLVKLADNTLHVTTVNGAPSGTTVTLTTGLASAANDNAFMYTFASSVRHTHMIKEILYASAITSNSDTVLDEVGGLATEVSLIGEVEMARMSNALQQGVPRTLAHIKKPTTSEFKVWPVGNTVDYDRIKMVISTPMMDMDATTDNLWIPPAAHNAVITYLAAELAPEYGVTSNERKFLKAEANMMINEFLDNYVENASMILSK